MGLCLRIKKRWIRCWQQHSASIKQNRMCMWLCVSVCVCFVGRVWERFPYIFNQSTLVLCLYLTLCRFTWAPFFYWERENVCRSKCLLRSATWRATHPFNRMHFDITDPCKRGWEEDKRGMDSWIISCQWNDSKNTHCWDARLHTHTHTFSQPSAGLHRALLNSRGRSIYAD